MKQIFLITAGILAFVIIVFVISSALRPVLSPIFRIGRSSITPTPTIQKLPSTEEKQKSPQISGLEGQTVFLTQTKIQSIISGVAFWTGPISSKEKSLLVITSNGGAKNFRPGQIVKVTGTLRKYSENSVWGLSGEDIKKVKTQGMYLDATLIQNP
ncbi:MAG: hypothetical protein COX79_01460 [Candidatus Levybacteria bacterium CG_4_10_14_0_2_um_filter_36_16]|nr:MAG: hypothetical protein AUK12_03240 [Candidatus Levybacteria bacterium CG2_30_37_29]PIR79106.1 MAG: hypothetical protein COU26_02885 [Candidatus Levybacteria bacterium CG10_big_fil_rev_8_21_14_0_10_36_30]PIZ97628.1 MAG: hypothetical protein COX79_01460 [Candidatus Levybacteria bacterium CG_4_10_14_0_2_um_filter_36_16]PJA90250.1 MAG: hypothetical protein CO136_02660 [Candidatus Levybacteria bacterium CG_4_9_14_3_um_filter_36_7]